MLVKDAKKLKKIMVIQEVSQRAMAKELGWQSHTYVGRILNGEIRSVSTDTATIIARVLGLPVEDLFLAKLDSPNVHSGHPKSSRSRKVPA